MVSASNLAAFALAAFVIIVVPGPSVLFVVGRALSLGRGPAFASVVGNALGVYAVAVLVAFGLGSIVQRSELAFTAVKVVGAAYLIWLGIQAIRHRHDLVDALSATPVRTSWWRAARQGFVVGFANPKALIMFGTVPTAWVLAASRARTWFGTDPRRLAMVGGTGGLAMIGVGVSVAATGRRD